MSGPSPNAFDRREAWLQDLLEEGAVTGADALDPALERDTLWRVLAKARGELPVGRPPGYLEPLPGLARRPGPVRRLVDRAYPAARALLVAACLLLILCGAYFISRQIRVIIRGPDGRVREIEVSPADEVEIRRGDELVTRIEPAAGGDTFERVIDDAETGFRTTGDGWRTSRVGGFRGGHTYNSRGARSAFWRFEGLPPGRYAVEITWQHMPGRPFRVPYRVREEGRLLDDLVVDQSVAPRGAEMHGVRWLRLGTYRTSGGVLEIELDSTGSKVRSRSAVGAACSADAVRVVRRPEPAGPPEIIGPG